MWHWGEWQCGAVPLTVLYPQSLVEHRRSIEPPDSKTPPTLLRFSVGLEDVNDLLADIDHALASIEVDCSAASKL